MPRYPHTKLFNDFHHVVVLSGPHIQVLDTHGQVLKSSANLTLGDPNEFIKGGPIRCSGMSRDGRYLATSGDDKQLKIWDIVSFTLLNTRELPKKPTSIEFSKTTDILVSDKFGDIFMYALHPNEPVEIASDALASHEKASNGQPLLGHASLLTSCLTTPDGEFIITADRDEHIRVSWYPEGYVIQSYCLGHKKYVSAIHVPVACPAVLISGGGDPELKVWDWMTGHLQRNITVYATVEPFIRVTVPQEKMTPNAPFVVRKISSFLFGGENHIVFSVLGATAIFEFTLGETSDQPDIHHHNFGSPVIEFAVCHDGTIWVLLDADFPHDSDAGFDQSRKLVQVVQWSTNEFVNAGSSTLLDSLNTICSLPATAEDLQTLDLYSDLATLPKTINRDHESLAPGQCQSNHKVLGYEPSGESASVSVSLTKRALGRLKHKRALEQLHSEMGDNQNVSVPDRKKIKGSSDNEELDGAE